MRTQLRTARIARSGPATETRAMASIPFERVRRLTLAPSINRRSIVSARGRVRVTALVSGETSLTTVGLIAVLLGAFLATTDFSIVNVALPTIDADLHASAGMLQLVVAGYGTPFALLLVVGGRLGDAFGRRRLFSIGHGGFHPGLVAVRTRAEHRLAGSRPCRAR